MKSNLTFTIMFTFIATLSFGQFSIGSGLTVPMGAYNQIENGAADLGYQIATGYDISLDQRYGISTGLLIGQNALNNNSTNFNEGRWSYILFEAGAYLKLANKLKLKGLVTTGNYASPEFNIENGTITSNKISYGLDIKLEYNFSKFYLASNFLYSKPQFELLSGNREDISISSLGLILGYTF